jgi:hypothetical protein
MEWLSHNCRHSRLNSNLIPQLSLHFLTYLLMNFINQASLFSLILIFSSYVFRSLRHASLIVPCKIRWSFILLFIVTRCPCPSTIIVLNANKWCCFLLVPESGLTSDLIELAFQSLTPYYLLIQSLSNGDLDSLLVINNGRGV